MTTPKREQQERTRMHGQCPPELAGLSPLRRSARRVAMALVCGANSRSSFRKADLPEAGAFNRQPVAQGKAKGALDVLAAIHGISARRVAADPERMRVQMQHALADVAMSTHAGLADMIGRAAIERLIEGICETYSLSVDHLRKQSPDAIVEDIKCVLAEEQKHLEQARAHTDALFTSAVENGAGSACSDQVVPAAHPPLNDIALEKRVDSAADWIIRASTSKGNQYAIIRDVLSEYVHNNADLTDFAVVEQLHRALVKNVERTYRGPAISGRSLPSSVGGRVLLERHMEKLHAMDQDDLGRHLFVGVVRYHGFVDGNGRTARALYAIAELRQGRFTPPFALARSGPVGASVR